VRLATIAADPASRHYLAIATVEPSFWSGALRINSLSVTPSSPGKIGNCEPTNLSPPWKIIAWPLRTVDGSPNLTPVLGKPLDNFALSCTPFFTGYWIG
jgi:hypothetical protein